MPSRDFYFIRHGQTDWNKEERLQGRTDIPLNETGREQARQSLNLLKKQKIDLIVSSTMSRATETAQIINGHFNVPLHGHDDLSERSFGSNEGMIRADILARYAQEPHLYKLSASGTPHPMDAESNDAVKERAMRAIKRFLTDHTGNILFVAHGGVFSVVHNHLLKGANVVRSENAVPYRFYIDNNSWKCDPLE